MAVSTTMRVFRHIDVSSCIPRCRPRTGPAMVRPAAVARSRDTNDALRVPPTRVAALGGPDRAVDRVGGAARSAAPGAAPADAGLDRGRRRRGRGPVGDHPTLVALDADAARVARRA